MTAAARLIALSTAVPRHVLPQPAVRAAARALFAPAFPDIDRLMPLFDNAGIECRYSCLPIEGHLRPRGFAERNRLAVEEAVALLEVAAVGALERAELQPAQIDAVVTVCSTGIATPSLDAVLAERLGLRPDIERTPLFGLGCAGGVLGLARATALARARPGTRVLLLVVELCTLTLRLNDLSKANLVACALFGDGAAAALLSTEADGPKLGASGEHRFPQSLEVMGWRVEDDGLGVLFSIAVPEVARRALGAPLHAFLEREGLLQGSVDRWICHPGGARVLDGLCEALGAEPSALEDARAVLAAYGNMSSATVLFVLERALAVPAWLMVALGPGFTAGFQLIERDG
jgi:alkylresorcinol/alkylpyrone synthase